MIRLGYTRQRPSTGELQEDGVMEIRVTHYVPCVHGDTVLSNHMVINSKDLTLDSGPGLSQG